MILAEKKIQDRTMQKNKKPGSGVRRKKIPDQSNLSHPPHKSQMVAP